MSAPPILTAISASHRLDKTLFWLRWLFLIGMVLLALLAEKSGLGDTTVNQTKLLVSLGLGASMNVLIGLATLSPQIEDRILGVLSAVLDSILAAMFFWTYEANIVPLFLLGTLAVTASAIRLGWTGIGMTTGIMTGGSLLAIIQVGGYNTEQWLIWALSIGFLVAFGIFGEIFRSSGISGDRSFQEKESQAEYEAQRLRATRERAQAIFDMATALSASLDHQMVLTEAQNIGMFGLRDQLGDKVHLVSAVMLFQGNDNQLRVITGRGLTRNDQTVALPGRRGVLGLALKQAEPVFSGDPSRDPELRNFMGFQNIQSVLVIPLRAGIDVYGVMIFGCDKPNAFSDDHVELMTAIGTQSTVSLQNAVLYQNLATEKERIVEVEEGARKKLSRDLHDGPTQSVAAIAMRVNYIRRLIERQPQQAIEELWKVEELARRTTKEIRHMLFTLRPLVLETQGLLAALAQLADKMRDTHDTNVVLQALPDVENYLDTNSQGVLFYVIEEAVNNARKHAQSEHIYVRIYHRDQQYVVVEIEDDGVGFDVQAVNTNYEQRGSLGMINMRERAELIEGTARVQSAPGRGTKITVVVPVQAGSLSASEEAGGNVPPLELQSHRSGPQTGTQSGTQTTTPSSSNTPRAQTGPLGQTGPLSQTGPLEEASPAETPPHKAFKLPETGPLAAAAARSTQPEKLSRPTPPVTLTAPVSRSANPPEPAPDTNADDQPKAAPTTSSFASGGVTRPLRPLKAETQDLPDTSETNAATDFGQMFDSFANGGFAQSKSSAKSSAKTSKKDAPPAGNTQKPASRKVTRLGRARRPQSTSTPPEQPPVPKQETDE